MLTEREREQIEAEAYAASRTPADGISEAVGHHVFARNHRFPDLRARAWRDGSVVNSGLAVARYYFAVGVVVDVEPHPGRHQTEIEAKRVYCREHGLLYVLIEDAYDDHAVREQLAVLRAPKAATRTAGKKPVAEKRPKTRAAAAAR